MEDNRNWGYPSSPVPVATIDHPVDGLKIEAKPKVRRKSLKHGEGRPALVEAIVVNTPTSGVFTAADIYDWFNRETQNRWRAAYGDRKQTIGRIGSFLADMNRRTNFPMTRHGKETATFKYHGGWTVGKPLKNFTSVKAAKAAKKLGVTHREEQSATVALDAENIKTLGRFRPIGFNLVDELLFMDTETNTVGTLRFHPLT